MLYVVKTMQAFDNDNAAQYLPSISPVAYTTTTFYTNGVGASACLTIELEYKGPLLKHRWKPVHVSGSQKKPSGHIKRGIDPRE